MNLVALGDDGDIVHMDFHGDMVAVIKCNYHYDSWVRLKIMYIPDCIPNLWQSYGENASCFNLKCQG